MVKEIQTKEVSERGKHDDKKNNGNDIVPCYPIEYERTGNQRYG